MTKISQIKIAPILKKSYLKMIENSIGARLFQNFYVDIDGKKHDAVKAGRLSCAFFVSSILNNFGLIRQSHLTVNNTVKDMRKSGWTEIGKPKKGAILVWEKKVDQKGNIHKHIGFYISNKQAISNSFHRRIPVCHHWTFGQRGSKSYRRIITIFWHKKLN